MSQLKCIAYYLGQFHPTRENDKFWGEGFSEWHNVAKARPLYPRHAQPVLPGRLGFYDLRCNDTLKEQMVYARHVGVDAFCHWHYWFGGRRILHSPLDRMLQIDPHFQFMLGWANESWTGVWHGQTRRMLIEQTYDDVEVKAHAELLARYLDSGSYLEAGGVHPFVIYKPRSIPQPIEYLGQLREVVRRLSGAKLYIIGNWTPGRSGVISSPSRLGLDAVVVTPVAAYFQNTMAQNIYSLLWQGFRKIGVGPEIRSYASASRTQATAIETIEGVAHATVLTGWDNTPRSKRRGLVLTGYNQTVFKKAATHAIELERRNKRQLLFVKSWNEWAEGNVLEPIFQETWSAGDTLRGILEQARSSVQSNIQQFVSAN